MGKTNRQEPRRTKKGESDAHKVRRDYKRELDEILTLDDDERDDVELDSHWYERHHRGERDNNER